MANPFIVLALFVALGLIGFKILEESEREERERKRQPAWPMMPRVTSMGAKSPATHRHVPRPQPIASPTTTAQYIRIPVYGKRHGKRTLITTITAPLFTLPPIHEITKIPHEEPDWRKYLKINGEGIEVVSVRISDMVYIPPMYTPGRIMSVPVWIAKSGKVELPPGSEERLWIDATVVYDKPRPVEIVFIPDLALKPKCSIVTGVSVTPPQALVSKSGPIKSWGEPIRVVVDPRKAPGEVVSGYVNVDLGARCSIDYGDISGTASASILIKPRHG